MAAAGEAPEVRRRLRFVSVGCSSWGLSTAGTTTLSGVTAPTTRRAASGSCPGDLRGVARLGQREQCGGGEQAGRDAEADASPDGPSEKTPARVNGSPRGVTSDRPRDQLRGQRTDGEIASDLRFCEQGGGDILCSRMLAPLSTRKPGSWALHNAAAMAVHYSNAEVPATPRR